MLLKFCKLPQVKQTTNLHWLAILFEPSLCKGKNVDTHAWFGVGAVQNWNHFFLLSSLFKIVFLLSLLYCLCLRLCFGSSLEFGLNEQIVVLIWMWYLKYITVQAHVRIIRMIFEAGHKTQVAVANMLIFAREVGHPIRGFKDCCNKQQNSERHLLGSVLSTEQSWSCCNVARHTQRRIALLSFTSTIFWIYVVN